MKLLLASMAILVGIVSSMPSFGTEAGSPRRLALLIGNWDYDGNGKFDETPSPDMQNDLRNPCKDVKLLKTALQRVQFGDIEEVCNLSKEAFEKRAEELAQKFARLPPGSVVLIYYSGHGIQQYGYLYTLPVLFRLTKNVQEAPANDQIQYLSAQAVDVQAMLDRFSKRKDLAIYIALDQCRNEALPKTTAFNDAVNIHTAQNIMIQYSAGPTDLTPDNSAFATLLAREIERGGDIGRIASRVYSESLGLYEKGKSKTYSVAIAGWDFGALRSPAMTLKAAEASPPKPTSPRDPSTKIDRRNRMFRDIYDNPSLDILWCEGEGELDRYSAAIALAGRLAENAKHYGVGRVLVKPLSVKANLYEGYNAWRNLLRFDLKERNERSLLEKVASGFPELALLPQRGVGVGGEPTKNYVSAFICEGFTGR